MSDNSEKCIGCKECNPELKIKDLKGTVEGFQIASGMLVMLMFIMGISIIALYDSRNFWREESSRTTTKYLSGVNSSSSIIENAKVSNLTLDVNNARARIQKLEIELIKAEADSAICRAERAKDVAQYEYRLLDK